MVKTHLITIDPQNDFCDPKGSLFVPNGDKDIQTIARFIDLNINKIEEIHVTLDSHHQMQVFHPMYWRDSKGNHPAPFTVITVDDVESGKWITTVPGWRNRALDYVKTLSTTGRYALVIWPYHCLIGSWGTQVHPVLFEKLMAWEAANVAGVNFITKGSNYHTEHYSAVKAEVIDPADESTQLSNEFIKTLTQADQILFAGEATDYCVRNTILDTADALGVDQAKKIKILRDCTSAIDPKALPKIEAEFKLRGIEFINSADAF